MSIHIVPDIHLHQKEIPAPSYPGSPVLVMLGDVLYETPRVPSNREYRKVLRKMLDKLSGRRRGYTPPAWWDIQNKALNKARTGRISYQGVGKTGKLLNLTEKARHVDCDCMACLPHTY